MIKLETPDYQYELTNLTWKDIHPKWFDWELLDKREEFNIIITTMMGVGKTFGCTDYYLRVKNVNISILLNTYGIIPQQSVKLLDDLKGENATAEQVNRYDDADRSRIEYYAGWQTDGDYWLDAEGNKRVYWAAINTYSKAKGARGFYPDIVIYDEINQNVKFAEQSGTTVRPKLNTIVTRFATETQSPKHIYYFANKNPIEPIQGLTLLNDLGIFTLKGFGEVFKVNIKFNVVNKVKIIPSTLVINPVYSIEDKVKIIETLIDNYKINPFYVELLLSDGGQEALFNDDEWNFEEYISPTNHKKLKYVLYTQGKYLAVYTRSDQLMMLSGFPAYIHIKVLKKLTKQPDKIYTWKKMEDENMYELNDNEKAILQKVYKKGQLTYEDTISRVYFGWMIGKR